jgi:site-specific DNA recombinase
MRRRLKKSTAAARAAACGTGRIAVAYHRVSTPRQADEGDSLPAQRAAATRFAAERGLRLALHLADAGKSGRTTRGRSALDLALAKVCASQGVLIVRSLSRLARSVIDLHTIVARLHKAGADLASVNELIDTSTAAGRAFFGFLAVMAQFESDLIAERTREAYRFRKSIGKPILAGVPRFGTRVTRGRLVSHPAAVKIIALIRRLRKQGKSYKQIAAALNRRGIKTPDQLYGRKRPSIRKAKWWPSSVHRLIQRAE